MNACRNFLKGILIIKVKRCLDLVLVFSLVSFRLSVNTYAADNFLRQF